MFQYLSPSPPAAADVPVGDLHHQRFVVAQGPVGAPHSSGFEISENVVPLFPEAIFSTLHNSESRCHFVPREISKPGARARCCSLVPEYVDNFRDMVSCEREYLSRYSASEDNTCHDDPSFMYDMYTCEDMPSNMCRGLISSSCPVRCRSCGVSNSPGNRVSSSGWSPEVQQLNIVMPPELTQSKSNGARLSRGNG